MSVTEHVTEQVASTRESAEEAYASVVSVVFGDRIGLTVFLAALVFFLAFWRISFVINDNYTVANALVAVADGHLDVRVAQYGPGLETPGMVVNDGAVYGRNYGHVFAALPFLWAIEAISTVASPRVAVAALWSLLVVALGVQAARVFDRDAVAAGGSVLALVLFAGNVVTTTPLDSYWFPMMALQVSSMVAAAFVGVALYRLFAHIHSQRVGFLAGLVVVVATPVGLWAAIPKRHAIVTALLVACVYALYRSRAVTTDREATRYRALAYAWVGLMTWIQPLEAFLVFLALGAVDIPTARSNDVRSLATIGGVFALSLVPFVVTNVLISGNPFVPPRMLDAYENTPGGVESVGTSAGGAATAVSMLVMYAERGVETLVAAPTKVVDVFVRSGYIEGVTARDGNEAINLTMLESAPVLGVLLAAPVLLVRRVRQAAVDVRPVSFRRARSALTSLGPARVTDAFVLLCTVAFVVIYLPRLPIHASVTVRYLLPLFALGVYGVARLGVVHDAVETAPWTVASSAAGVVLIGGQLVFVWLHVTGAAIGEAFQFHALLGLFAGTLLGTWALAATVLPNRSPRLVRVGALALGVAIGVGAMLLVLIGVDYFGAPTDFALGLIRRLALLLETA